MGRWRAKLVLTTVVYTAGFLSAIYFMAPVPENQQFSQAERIAMGTAIDREKIVKNINEALHKCVNLGKEAAGKIAITIQDNMKERLYQTSTTTTTVTSE